MRGTRGKETNLWPNAREKLVVPWAQARLVTAIGGSCDITNLGSWVSRPLLPVVPACTVQDSAGDGYHAWPKKTTGRERGFNGDEREEAEGDEVVALGWSN